MEVLIEMPSGEERRIKVARNSGFVVGDRVGLQGDRIQRLERRNELSRQTPFGPQTLAANLDKVIITVSSKPPTQKGFIDQIIVNCRSQNMKPMLALTKIDLAETKPLYQELNTLYSDSIPVCYGLKELRPYLAEAERFILVGVSGSGKSTLINQLILNPTQRIGDLSANQKTGKHTTSHSMLFNLKEGGELIDSPGIRDFRPLSVSIQEAAHYFPGFEKWQTQSCRFRNCTHHHEPECLVREAAKTKDYQRYLDFCLTLI
ncbi:MAG: ribosome small subunit-dependent GTPase A [Myxococcaceae bacterium]|nr:ribosome small subunit-dependent GTPase A [Myxococcaceae bacterium]